MNNKIKNIQIEMQMKNKINYNKLIMPLIKNKVFFIKFIIIFF
jgi:hypothetical protein